MQNNSFKNKASKNGALNKINSIKQTRDCNCRTHKVARIIYSYSLALFIRIFQNYTSANFFKMNIPCF